MPHHLGLISPKVRENEKGSAAYSFLSKADKSGFRQ